MIIKCLRVANTRIIAVTRLSGFYQNDLNDASIFRNFFFVSSLDCWSGVVAINWYWVLIDLVWVIASIFQSVLLHNGYATQNIDNRAHRSQMTTTTTTATSTLVNFVIKFALDVQIFISVCICRLVCVVC